MTSTPGSITRALAALRLQNEQSAELLWKRFFERLCGYAESRLYRRHRKLVDPDQIASDAFMALLDGVKNHRFEQVRNRDELWQMLTLIASRKTIASQRQLDRQKRGGGKVRGLSSCGGRNANVLEEFISGDLTPDAIVELEDLSRCLLAALPNDVIRKVAVLRMAGHANAEIAEKLSLTERTIERKLKLIREIWVAVNCQNE